MHGVAPPVQHGVPAAPQSCTSTPGRASTIGTTMSDPSEGPSRAGPSIRSESVRGASIRPPSVALVPIAQFAHTSAETSARTSEESFIGVRVYQPDRLPHRLGDRVCSCSGDISRNCATAMGACAAGSQRCVNGSWGECSILPVTETCNTRDDDCDGMTDEGLSVRCYADGDNDGYAAAGASAGSTCPVPGRDAFAGCPPNQTNRTPLGIDIDCNDGDSTVSPGQTELCDRAMRDEDCDGASNPTSLCMCEDGQTRPCTAPGTCGAGHEHRNSGVLGVERALSAW